MKKFLQNLIAPIAVALLISGLANGSFYQWSQNPNLNSNADPSINWAEGMAPSSVNDSARAMMAGLAQYRDDVSGLLQTAGTATAYTVTTSQGLPSTPTTGQLLVIRPHLTSGTSPTLRADSGTVYPIQQSPGVPVASASLVAGTPYHLTFNGTAWVLHSFYQNANFVPVGAVLPFAGSTAPNSNFVLAYGQCISRTTYATLFAIVGTTYGACDGSSTFGVPDLRGRVAAGEDDMGGVAASRLTGFAGGVAGNTLGAAGGAQSHTLTLAQIPVHNHAAGTLTMPAHSHTYLQTTQKTDVATGANKNVFDGNQTSNTSTYPATTITGSTADAGSGAAHNIVQPTIILTYIIRII